jgi:hypothetical protein
LDRKAEVLYVFYTEFVDFFLEAGKDSGVGEYREDDALGGSCCGVCTAGTIAKLDHEYNLTVYGCLQNDDHLAVYLVFW